eukprot:gene1398-biopygen21317
MPGATRAGCTPALQGGGGQVRAARWPHVVAHPISTAGDGEPALRPEEAAMMATTTTTAMAAAARPPACPQLRNMSGWGALGIASHAAAARALKPLKPGVARGDSSAVREGELSDRGLSRCPSPGPHGHRADGEHGARFLNTCPGFAHGTFCVAQTKRKAKQVEVQHVSTTWRHVAEKRGRQSVHRFPCAYTALALNGFWKTTMFTLEGVPLHSNGQVGEILPDLNSRQPPYAQAVRPTRNNAAWVEVDAQLLPDRLAREVGGELRADDAGVAMGARHAAPDHAHARLQLRVLPAAHLAHLVLPLEHVRDPLAAVELRVLRVAHILDAQQRRVVDAVPLAALVPHHLRRLEQPHRLAHRAGGGVGLEEGNKQHFYFSVLHVTRQCREEAPVPPEGRVLEGWHRPLDPVFGRRLGRGHVDSPEGWLVSVGRRDVLTECNFWGFRKRWELFVPSGF